MKISSAFPSKYLKAADLQSRTIKLAIDRVQVEDLGDEEKPILYFKGKSKGLVLNKTNSDVLAATLGDETEEWAGKEIELYPDKTHFQGKLVDCLRLRVPGPPPAEGAEEIPF
jgi:hypothetical protein